MPSAQVENFSVTSVIKYEVTEYEEWNSKIPEPWHSECQISILSNYVRLNPSVKEYMENL